MDKDLTNIINGCLQRDFNAQKALYNRFVDKLYYTAVRYVSDKFFIENILQDVFLKAFNNIEQYDNIKASISTWLNTITIRECLNHLRKTKLEFLPIDNQDISFLDYKNDFLLKMDADEILVIIQSIPAKYRVVFNLYEVDGFSHSEISKILKMKEGTSRSYLTRAKKMIQDAILLDIKKVV